MRQIALMALSAYQTVIDTVCRLTCYFVGHDWHYFSLKRADTGEFEFFQCCIRCEKSEKLPRWTIVEREGPMKADLFWREHSELS